MTHALFETFAHRYDLHTPPDHYRHDHAFVLDFASRFERPCRLLDVGCGTGVLVAKAQAAGVEATGIDASREMIEVAESRVATGTVRQKRMEEIDAQQSYDLIVGLSWTLNYAEDRSSLVDILRRMHRALASGGRIVLQVAHVAHVDGTLMEDREPGPDGRAGDVVFRYRFERVVGDSDSMRAEYEYVCESTGERCAETHILRMADARMVGECMRDAGFDQIELFDSWRRDPFKSSVSPFVCATKT